MNSIQGFLSKACDYCVPFCGRGFLNERTISFDPRKIIGHISTQVTAITLFLFSSSTEDSEPDDQNPFRFGCVAALVGLISLECLYSSRQFTALCIKECKENAVPRNFVMAHLINHEAQQLFSALSEGEKSIVLNKRSDENKSFLDLCQHKRTATELAKYTKENDNLLSKGATSHSLTQRVPFVQDEMCNLPFYTDDIFYLNFDRSESPEAANNYSPLENAIITGNTNQIKACLPQTVGENEQARLLSLAQDAKTVQFLCKECDFNPNYLDSSDKSVFENWLAKPNHPIECFAALIEAGALDDPILYYLQETSKESIGEERYNGLTKLVKFTTGNLIQVVIQ